MGGQDWRIECHNYMIQSCTPKSSHRSREDPGLVGSGEGMVIDGPLVTKGKLFNDVLRDAEEVEDCDLDDVKKFTPDGCLNLKSPNRDTIQWWYVPYEDETDSQVAGNAPKMKPGDFFSFPSTWKIGTFHGAAHEKVTWPAWLVGSMWSFPSAVGSLLRGPSDERTLEEHEKALEERAKRDGRVSIEARFMFLRISPDKDLVEQMGKLDINKT